MAAGAMTVTTVAQMIPDVWSAQFVETLRTKECLSKYVTVDSSLQAAVKGQTVKFAVPGSIAIQDKTGGSVYAFQNVTPGAAVSLTMSYHRFVQFVFEDPAELAATNGVRNYYIEDAVGQIVEDVNSKLMGTYAGWGALVGTNPDLGSADLVLGIGALDAAKVPADERTLVVHPLDKLALINDTALANYWMMGGGQQVMSEGKLPPLYGANIVVSPQVVLATNRRTPLFHKRALGFGCRALPPANGAISSVTREDPESGLVIRIWTDWSNTYGGTIVTVEALYGVVVLDANRIRMLPGAAS
jgi:hypothetical protein